VFCKFWFYNYLKSKSVSLCILNLTYRQKTRHKACPLPEGIWWQKINFSNNYIIKKLQFPNTCELNSHPSPAPPPPHPGLPHYRVFTIILRHPTLCRTPLDEWSALRRDLYLTTQNNYDKHPRCRRELNPQSQQASSRWVNWIRPTNFFYYLGYSREIFVSVSLFHLRCHMDSLAFEQRIVWGFDVREMGQNYY
jgi:hypothetical protein